MCWVYATYLLPFVAPDSNDSGSMTKSHRVSKTTEFTRCKVAYFYYFYFFFYVNKVGLEKLQFKGYNKLFLYFCCNSLARLHTLHFTRINKLWLLYYLRWTKTSTHWDALWQDEKRRFVLEMGDLILIVCSIYNDQDLDRQPDWHSGSQNCPNDLKKCSVSIKLIETSVYKSLWGD